MHWIDTKELVPENSDIVLGYDAFSGTITLSRFFEEEEGEGTFESMSMNSMEQDFSITHWHPIYDLPEIPED